MIKKVMKDLGGYTLEHIGLQFTGTERLTRTCKLTQIQMNFMHKTFSSEVLVAAATVITFHYWPISPHMCGPSIILFTPQVWQCSIHFRI